MRQLVVAMVACLVVAIGVALAARGPTPKGDDAPIDAFSAARAFVDVRMIAGHPHPPGSIDHDRVRDALLLRMRALGLHPEVHTNQACNKGACARVENLFAAIDDREDPNALLLVAHYDSRKEGPGAADDASGVATILEIVRALKAGPPTKNAIFVLFTDAEEMGLVGARAFVEQDANVAHARVVLNFEARGTAGQVAMFETSGRSGWLVEAWAHAVSRPVSSSVIYSLYKALPNDTDLTVFKEKGLLGLNFAFADAVWNYHTANDDPEHLDLRSLQHMGDQGLATTRALASADLSRAPDGDVVWFDLFTWKVVVYRPWVAWALLVLAIGATATAIRRAEARTAVVKGAFLAVAALVLAIVVGVVAMIVIPRAATFATPMPAWIALTTIGVAIPCAFAWRGRRVFSAEMLSTALAALFTLLAALTTAFAIGASYLFVFPALAFALAAIEPRASFVPPVVAATLWFPLARILLVMVGAQVPPVTTLVVALFALAMMPLVPYAFGKSGGGSGPATQPLASASK